MQKSKLMNLITKAFSKKKKIPKRFGPSIGCCGLVMGQWQFPKVGKRRRRERKRDAEGRKIKKLEQQPANRRREREESRPTKTFSDSSAPRFFLRFFSFLNLNFTIYNLKSFNCEYLGFQIFS